MDTAELSLLGMIVALLAGRTVMGRKPTSKSWQGSRNLVVDSCGLIDGRILELATLGYLPGAIRIPEFILHELQMLADNSDAQRRERARFGLDIAKQLQELPEIEVIIDPLTFKDQPIDDMLVSLAKKRQAVLYTTDFNLNKLADIKGVHVLNINQLAQRLRPVALPGEAKTVTIIQKGNNPKQGVGYMDDGTMFVVENGAKHIGRKVEVVVTRVHQTVSGKMLFGELANPQSSKPPKNQSS